MSDDHLLLHRCFYLATLGFSKNAEPRIGWVLTDLKKSILAEGFQEGPILSNLSGSSKIEAADTLFYINHLPQISDKLLQLFEQAHIRKIITAHSAHAAPLPDGVEIAELMLQKEEAYLNRRFYTSQKKQRPYVILKWAQTADGLIARENYDSKWISGPLSRKLVHKWRSEEAAIMVATNTARYDNPRLNVRDWSGKDPVRVVIDRQLRLPAELHLFDHTQPTLCYNSFKEEKQENLQWIKIDAPDELSFLKLLLADLYQKKMPSLIVEGGSHLLCMMVAHQMWDEARVFIAPQSFGKGISAPPLPSSAKTDEKQIGDDLLLFYQNF